MDNAQKQFLAKFNEWNTKYKTSSAYRSSSIIESIGRQPIKPPTIVVTPPAPPPAENQTTRRRRRAPQIAKSVI